MSERTKTVLTTLGVIFALLVAGFFVYMDYYRRNEQPCNTFAPWSNDIPYRCFEEFKRGH